MIDFDNSYLNFPTHFYSMSKPAVFSSPKLLAFNDSLAFDIGLAEVSRLSDEEKAKYFSGQSLFSNGAYISLAYSGHQFGHFNPTLGDGRAMLIGETSKPNKVDIQLKGSGPTQYSRRGDGMSSLGPVIREYLVSESMHYLNIPTTRALCACYTGDSVSRQTLEPGGVFTRVASSHIRVGNFEFLAANSDYDGLKKLLYYSIDRHYPELNNLLASNVKVKDIALAFIEAVSKKQALLIAKWMSIGFIHGVMNTDNMSISGETIDYGPCAFMDHFKKDKVFSFIDQYGRYAYNQQPKIGLWNLYQLANSLALFFTKDDERDLLEQSLKDSHRYYTDYYYQEMLKKFGVTSVNIKSIPLIDSFLNILEENKLDFTNSFLNLTYKEDMLRSDELFKVFFQQWDQMEVDKSLMKKVNPYLIPRNHHIEKIIQEVYAGDESSFKSYLDRLKEPFNIKNKDFLSPPLPEQIVKNTFCGT